MSWPNPDKIAGMNLGLEGLNLKERWLCHQQKAR
jgi:hypothetical protein